MAESVCTPTLHTAADDSAAVLVARRHCCGITASRNRLYRAELAYHARNPAIEVVNIEVQCNANIGIRDVHEIPTLVAMGEEEASEVLKHLGPREVQRIGSAIATLSNVPKEEVETVLKSLQSVKNIRAVLLALGLALSVLIGKATSESLPDTLGRSEATPNVELSSLLPSSAKNPPELLLKLANVRSADSPDGSDLEMLEIDFPSSNKDNKLASDSSGSSATSTGKSGRFRYLSDSNPPEGQNGGSSTSFVVDGRGRSDKALSFPIKVVSGAHFGSFFTSRNPQKVSRATVFKY